MDTQSQKLGFLGWALGGGIFFGRVPGANLGGIGAALIGAGAIPALRGMQMGKPNSSALFVVCVILGCVFLAAGYRQYYSQRGEKSAGGGEPTPVMPLHDAASKGHRDAAELLLANNVEVNAKDRAGCTPLHYAAISGVSDVTELLLAHGAQVNAKDYEGETPLHKAAHGGHMDVAALLLAHHAEVNAKNAMRRTPLDTAARYGHGDTKGIAELLVANNADVNARDKFRETPTHAALENSHNDMAELLRQHGGHE